MRIRIYLMELMENSLKNKKFKVFIANDFVGKPPLEGLTVNLHSTQIKISKFVGNYGRRKKIEKLLNAVKTSCLIN